MLVWPLSQGSFDGPPTGICRPSIIARLCARVRLGSLLQCAMHAAVTVTSSLPLVPDPSADAKGGPVSSSSQLVTFGRLTLLCTSKLGAAQDRVLSADHMEDNERAISTYASEGRNERYRPILFISGLQVCPEYRRRYCCVSAIALTSPPKTSRNMFHDGLQLFCKIVFPLLRQHLTLPLPTLAVGAD